MKSLLRNPSRFACGATLLALALLLVPATAQADDLRHLRTAPGAEKIAPELLDKLEAEANAAFLRSDRLPEHRIVVTLHSVEKPEEISRAFANPAANAALQNNIRQLQDRVLDGRLPGIFKVWNRYQSTYGFSAHADARAIGALAAKGEVRRIEELPIYYKTDAQAHPLTNTDDAHTAGFTGDGVTIAIIDDGIDHDHSAFGGSSSYPNSKILGGYDFADNDSNPRVDCTGQSHGTSVAGVAAGDGGGVTGTAPDAKIVFLKIQSASLCGQPALDGDIPGAIDWAVTNRNSFSPAIKVISMSLGNPSVNTNSPCTSIAEASALNAAASAGMVTVVASGNEGGKSGISSPACHPSAVSVGAVYDASLGSANFGICVDSSTFADLVTCYSNSGTILDMLAPSHCAFTAQTGGSTNSCFGGTSSATPYAAGVFATLFEKVPSLSRSAAITAVTSTGVSINDPGNGVSKPRVDHMAALDSIGGSGPGPNSCEDRCDTQAPGGCWCDDACETYGDCCSDHDLFCGEPDPNSCVGNCGGQAPGGCWCDSSCSFYGDCCSDKSAVCG